jgi:hypothetical protein
VTGSGRAWRALLVGACAALGATVLAVGCDDAGAHVFSGEQYDPTRGCLEPVSSIDIVTGPMPGSCAPACILALPLDGGEVAYVTTMCPPYPVFHFEDDAGGNPLCALALAAFKRNALCQDGGVVVPASDAAIADAGAPAPDATESGASDGSSLGDGTADAQPE